MEYGNAIQYDWLENEIEALSSYKQVDGIE